jgi:hypothetical protein
VANPKSSGFTLETSACEREGFRNLVTPLEHILESARQADRVAQFERLPNAVCHVA